MFQSSNVELLLYLFGAEFDEYGGTKKLDQFCLFYEIQGVYSANFKRYVVCFESWKLGTGQGKCVWQCIV